MCIEDQILYLTIEPVLFCDKGHGICNIDKDHTQDNPTYLKEVRAQKPLRNKIMAVTVCTIYKINTEQHIEALEVLKTTKAEGFYVAFKTTLPNNTCPAYDRILPVVNIGEDPITWTKSGTTFSFKKCIGDWKMFNRTNSKVIVCMKPFHIPNWCNITEARGFCENMGYKVTGVATVEESRWIWKKTKGTRYYSFYIDGVRTKNCSLTRCNKFEFSDGYTVIDDAVLSSTNADLSFNYEGIPENCLGVAELGNVRTINDVRCDSTNKNVGVVCGYKLY
ncbi:hypothetical protein GCK72_021321 [Caenorhabditis remanei]|uniref:C-type lectin domain-containing protein n=1 Tax=Caenorhabditis remanei TaxID=31234 RepID=A0A6A5GHU0_CAERE|nr:hypothetical protein GCK72_021321 [Caenorhabditis remanei]KAF1754757.1 hypothetical protein GCK72_021321 [Caenorhabditis remanei]